MSIYFSIHSPLAGRDTGDAPVSAGLRLFNPLAPCGARPWTASTRWNTHTFQSTRPLRGETQHYLQYLKKTTFQSTRPLRGETEADINYRMRLFVFNPLAPCGARPLYCWCYMESD